MLKSKPQNPILPITINTNNKIFSQPSKIKSKLKSIISSKCKSIEVKPLLSRASSFTTINSSLQPPQRRRRCSSHGNLLLSLSYGDDDDDDDDDDHTFSFTRFSLNLLTYFRVGYRWIIRFLALGCYALLLMPGFVQVAYNYFFSRRIRRGIVYGDQPRNTLDLYLPKNNNGPKPVVAFVTGGAWIIGYKAWGSLLGQQLSDRDIIVACIDYRNFPQGTMRDMIDDASRGVSFVCKNIEEYGGDPNRIYLMGQSAGAHISACTLVEQAVKEACGQGGGVLWSVSQIKAYFGLSGGYNLLNLVDHFHNRGLYRSIFLSIMGGERSLQHYSPEIVVKDPNVRSAVSQLPPMILFHGTADYSIPSDDSVRFAETLRGLGVDAQAILYEGKTHTDVFLQDPMRGGNDLMFEDLVAIIFAEDDKLANDAMAPQRKRMVPEIMLKLARAVSPF